MNVDNLKNPLHNLCKPTLEISHHSLQSSTVRVGTYGCENTIYEFAEDENCCKLNSNQLAICLSQVRTFC